MTLKVSFLTKRQWSIEKQKERKCKFQVKQHDSETNHQGDRGSKMVSEIYLTRLLATKVCWLILLQILNRRIGFPRPSLNVVIDYFSHSFLKMCKIDIKHILDATFLDCLALIFCDVIGELLPEWTCLTLEDGTTPYRVGQHFAWRQSWRIFLSQEWG